MDIRKPDNPLEPFEGISGKIYRNTDISAGRCAYVMKKSLELLLSQSAMDFQGYQKKLMDALNQSKVGDAAVMVSDMSKGVEMVSAQVDTVMYYCAAIFNTEDEDVKEVDEVKFEDKIKDWSDIDHTFFLKAALATIPGLMQRWQKVADSSEMFKADLVSVLSS